ncbi:MAG TPA: acyltransferase [Bacteroidales bacterium]|nr:acyltransferase [Bacteroidales bacterium]HQI44915.1 acyltransferase [Bacteroidales bacterium]
MLPPFKNSIFEINNENDFNELAIRVFQYQYQHIEIYTRYVNQICKDIRNITHYSQIPFLPISFFRTHPILATNKPAEAVFESSGTTGSIKSHHYVSDLSIYKKSALLSFERCYGAVSDYIFLALLPSYLERNNSSLVWMARLFMQESKYSSDCGFYLNNYDELLEKLKKLSENNSPKIILLGVSYALLDLAEKMKSPLNNVIVMETGGMKGQRKEIIREELHEILCQKMGVNFIHSEYGMTELLSQAYSKGKGIYKAPPWMKVLIRELNDPFSYVASGRQGGINIIDLANINSCSFISTEDIGKTTSDGCFDVLGRFDYSDTRGCNLMIPD